jgi:hypothetical protein
MSSIMEATGSLVQGVSSRKLAQRQSTLLQSDAAEAQKLGALQSDMIRQDQARGLGDAVANQGASGFGLDAGALAVIKDMASAFDHQARTARYEAQRTRDRLYNDAAGARYQGRQALIQGTLNAAGAIAGGAEKAATAGASGGGG